MNAAKLGEVVGRMDRTPWSFDDPEPPAGSVDIRGDECKCDDADDTADPPASVMCPQHEYVAEWVTLPNAAAIVTLVNHATALVELVAACERLSEIFDGNPNNKFHYPQVGAVFRALRAVQQIGADREEPAP